MPLFRSKRNYAWIKRKNRELIERIIDEKITYYPISKRLSETNFYGESKNKVVDPPVILKCLVQWEDQDISTTGFGQDRIYNLSVYILKDHLDIVGVEPIEGDMIDYDDQKFEITKITKPTLIFGKEHEEIGTRLECVSVRDNTFQISVSGANNPHLPTAPDDTLQATQSFGNVSFPRSGSIYS